MSVGRMKYLYSNKKTRNGGQQGTQGKKWIHVI